MEATAPHAQKDRSLRYFHDRTVVGTLEIDLRVLYSSEAQGMHSQFIRLVLPNPSLSRFRLDATCRRSRQYGVSTLTMVSLSSQLIGPSIIEMALGTICGCMPYLAPTLKRWGRIYSQQLYLLKDIKSRIAFRYHKRSDQPKYSTNFNRVNSQPHQDHHLPTNILGSGKGAGKFLDSRDPKLREWLDRTAISQQGHNEGAIPENWSV